MKSLLARLRQPDPAKGAPWLPAPTGVPGFDFAGTSLFRYRRGGDYHDIFVPPGGGEGRLAVAVGDVAGHDSLSARLMEAARDLLRAESAQPGGLAALVDRLNRELVGRMEAGRFMTLFLALMVSETRSIHWVNAGQGSAIAYDPGQDIFREVGGPDIPLGIDPGWRFRELEHTGWPSGAMLVIGTDGVWETRGPSGAMYGFDRLCGVIRTARDRSAAEIVQAVVADLETYRAGRRQSDDLTLVVVKAV